MDVVFQVAFSTFATFLLIDPSNVLTPQIAFVSLTLFNQLRTPMSTVAELVSQTVQVFRSLQNVGEDLQIGDCVESPTERFPCGGGTEPGLYRFERS